MLRPPQSRRLVVSESPRFPPLLGDPHARLLTHHLLAPLKTSFPRKAGSLVDYSCRLSRAVSRKRSTFKFLVSFLCYAVLSSFLPFCFLHFFFWPFAPSCSSITIHCWHLSFWNQSSCSNFLLGIVFRCFIRLRSHPTSYLLISYAVLLIILFFLFFFFFFHHSFAFSFQFLPLEGKKNTIVFGELLSFQLSSYCRRSDGCRHGLLAGFRVLPDASTCPLKQVLGCCPAVLYHHHASHLSISPFQFHSLLLMLLSI